MQQSVLFIYFINFIYLLFSWIDVFVENQPPKEMKSNLGCVLFITESEPAELYGLSLGSILPPPHRRSFCSHEIETQMVQVTYPILCAQ